MACLFTNTAVPCAMAHLGMINPYFLVPFFATQARSINAIVSFKFEKASIPSAKHLKRTQYPPFMILLVGFVATTAYKRFEKRRDKDNEEWTQK